MAVASGNGVKTAQNADQSEIVLSVRDVTVAIEDKLILDKLSLDIERGEILGFVGGGGGERGGGVGPTHGGMGQPKGNKRAVGVAGAQASHIERLRIDMRLGVLFQHGALFSALTVLENVQVPMREYLDLPKKLMDELAMLKVELVGLPPDAAQKFPSELSGGMIKRAALARALALDPDIVFLDEPTSGLDPISAAEFDELVVKLRDTMDLTVYMVTHDLDTLFTACDHVAVLGKKRVLVEGTIDDMLKSEEPWVKSYFRGKRARQLDLAARAQP
ncbi:ATP-binding cassette domain-containing protein [Mesorhizobium sp. WSM4887]|uniref:ABC transporter ATP-binding protein n=2 Tax=unclassified Mesorhizobium TaxID=325217 RepID=UPI0024160D54|nr:ATP-binding cassette domain-containing protein [Mesorhizobium sp. WSM4887]MDG4885922.1 ATP-binding cassette domain-containing protein [Mesorhizobium sp. WSM4887]